MQIEHLFTLVQTGLTMEPFPQFSGGNEGK